MMKPYFPCLTLISTLWFSSPISDKRGSNDHVSSGGPDGIGDNGDCGEVIRVMVMVTMIRRVIVLLHALTAKYDQVCVIGECCPSPRHVTNSLFAIYLPLEIGSSVYFHKGTYFLPQIIFQSLLTT